MEEWPLISCQVSSKLIRHYRRKLCYLGKRRLQKVFNNRDTIIMTSVFWRKTFISLCALFFYFNERLDFCEYFK